MAELDPIIQDLILNAAEYVAGMDEVIAVIEDAASHEEALTAMTEVMTHLINEAGAAARDLAQGFVTVAGSEEAAAAAAEHAEAVYSILVDTEKELRNALLELAAAEKLASDWNSAIITDALASLIARLGMADARFRAFRQALINGADALAAWNQRMKDAGGAAAQWIRQWGPGIHWIVMGSLEILSTAIPAIVAFSAAIMAMSTTFTHINDVMQNLRAATGSWTAALAHSVPPLQAVGQNMTRLRALVAPDAYIIFGAAINALTGNVGKFSGIAQQASNVLAQFASKMSAALSGPMGAQLAGFFANAVRDMTQWGQVIGNIGHIFLSVINSMWGVSHLLLAIFVQITAALSAIASNRIVDVFIGIAAAMSAAYRWGILLVGVWRFIGGAALVATISSLAQKILMAAEYTTLWSAAVGVLKGEFMAAIGGMFGLVTLILAITSALLIWAAVAFRTKTATDNLITSINKMSPSVSNLALGMSEMEANVLKLYGTMVKLPPTLDMSATTGGRFSGTLSNVLNPQIAITNDQINKSISEMQKLANQMVNLVTGMTQAGMRTGAVGAAMNALAIQTAIADSKIQQINQALDQYIGILTGATSGNANFILSMSRIADITGTTALKTGTATAGMTLSVNQFAKALTAMGTTGAQAWQNFDSVITNSMQPLMDEFRLLATTGALTSQQVTQGALDMAIQLAKYAGTNAVARSQILGFLAAQGLTFPSFAAFEAAAKKAGAGQRNLNGIVAAGTIAFSHLSAMAKQAAAAMNPLVAQAIDQAALKVSGFNRALGKLQTDMINRQPSSVILADMQAIQRTYNTALQIAERVGQGISQSSSTTAGNVHTSSQKIQSAWDTAKLKQLGLEAQVQSSSGKISGHTNTMSTQVNAAMNAIDHAFDNAKTHAQSLQNFINSMHGKTITVTTNFVTTGQVPGAGIPGLGGTAGSGGGGHHPAVARGGGNIIVHVAGHVATSQGIARAIQGTLNQHTIRNPSTNLFITGRKH